MIERRDASAADARRSLEERQRALEAAVGAERVARQSAEASRNEAANRAAEAEAGREDAERRLAALEGESAAKCPPEERAALAKRVAELELALADAEESGDLSLIHI